MPTQKRQWRPQSNKTFWMLVCIISKGEIVWKLSIILTANTWSHKFSQQLTFIKFHGNCNKTKGTAVRSLPGALHTKPTCSRLVEERTQLPSWRCEVPPGVAGGRLRVVSWLLSLLAVKESEHLSRRYESSPELLCHTLYEPHRTIQFRSFTS